MSFWMEAKGQSFQKQVLIWETHVENKYADLYSSVVWNKKVRKNWEEFRKVRLKESFEEYETSYDDIIKYFESFENTLNTQIIRYSELFPDADFGKTPIYAIPSLGSFNGKAGGLDSKQDETILVFGLDLIHKRRDDPNILYAHELFHIYHVDKMELNEKVAIEQGMLTLPLWLEGFATWISGKLNPDKTINYLMMDDKYLNIKNINIRKVARKFLLNSEEKAFDDKSQKIYRSWFSSGAKPAVAELPDRIGYYLGYFVVDDINKHYGVSEMVHWKYDRAHKEVMKSLARLSYKKNK